MLGKVEFKRPKEGYSTQEEREFASWSNVSEYEIILDGEKIGFVYKTSRWNETEWVFEITSLEELTGREMTLSDAKQRIKTILNGG